MIIANTLPTFPGCPSYGFTSEPNYLTKKVMREGGFERRDRKWAHPLHRYLGTPMGPRVQDDIETLLEFWHAMAGDYYPFRFRDYVDYKSSRLGGTPAATDQPLALHPDSPAGFQLIKRYEVFGLEQLRPIYRPDGATIRIANNVGVEQVASTWTIDENTGVLTVTGGFSGTPGTWGGEFYVKARFEPPFAPEIVNKKIINLVASIVELREGE